jgi:hypothetical protein
MRNFKNTELLLSSRFAEGGFAGFWPPIGWLDLVAEIHEHLLPNSYYRISQVKEKFGELRFYAHGLTDEECDYVHEKEKEAAGVCQQCGSRDNVDLYDKGPYATLCELCVNTVPVKFGYSH